MKKDRILAALLILAISMPMVVGSSKPAISQSESTWVGMTIYIKADGSVEPSDAPIVTQDYETYIITSNIQITEGDGIVIERDNIILDGNGHTIQGPGDYTGILLISRTNIIIKNLTITGFYYGIYMYESSNNVISNNTISNTGDAGILMGASDNNMITGNTLRDNNVGVGMYRSRYNVFLYNNFVNNDIQVALGNDVGYNVWDNGVVGNYWSDHLCIDVDENGICDNPYVIRDLDNVDRYPSAYPYPFEIISVDVNTLVVFVRATGGDVWYGLTSSDGSVDWKPLGGIVADAPSVAFYKGKIYVIARSEDGALWYGVVDPVNWNFNGWVPLQGLAGSRPSVVATDYGVAVAVRDFDNGLWVGLLDENGVNWVSIPGATVDSPAIAYLDGELHIVVRGLDGYTIWHGVLELHGFNFKGWRQVNGLTNSAPELLVVGDTLYLAVRDLGNGVALATYNKLIGWLGWIFIPGGLTDTQPNLAYFNGELTIIVKAYNDQTIWLARKDHYGYWNWVNIPGLTTHEPDLLGVTHTYVRVVPKT